MMRQAVTNQLPDVYYSGFHLLSELARTLAKRNQIVDLGPLLAADKELRGSKNYSDKIVALGKVDGKLYGLPFNASTPIMYYNERAGEEGRRRSGQDARQLGRA